MASDLVSSTSVLGNCFSSNDSSTENNRSPSTGWSVMKCGCRFNHEHCIELDLVSCPYLRLYSNTTDRREQANYQSISPWNYTTLIVIILERKCWIAGTE